MTQGYFPAKAYGGPPVSIENFCNLISSEAKLFIVTANHEYGSEEKLQGIKEGWQKVGNAQVIYLSEGQKNIKVFERITKKVKPDWIYLNSLFDAKNVLPFLKLASQNNIKILLAPRGELCAGAFKKKHKKLPYIAYIRLRGWFNNVVFQSTSDEETETIHKYLGVNKETIFGLANIPSVPSMEYKHDKKEPGSARFLFLSRIHPKKNLLSAIRYFENITGNVVFDIYGPLEDEVYWKECQEAISKLSDNVVVNYCGVVSHTKVHQVFSEYDAFLFPTFSENYGHVIAEALFVGTPVIVSNQTPWNDVNEANAGWSIDLNNRTGFIEAIQYIINCDNKKWEIISQNAMKMVAEKTRINELKSRYEKVLSLC